MKQHAQPIHGLQAAGARGGQQWRFERCVDNVRHQRPVRKPRRIDGDVSFAMHAERARIDEKHGVGKQFVRGFQGVGGK